MLDSIIDADNAEKYEGKIRSINKYISDNLKPDDLDGNSKNGLENRVEDSFEETCNSLYTEFPGVELKKLSVYDFMNKVRFVKKKYDEIMKKRK